MLKYSLIIFSCCFLFLVCSSFTTKELPVDTVDNKEELMEIISKDINDLMVMIDSLDELSTFGNEKWKYSYKVNKTFMKDSDVLQWDFELSCFKIGDSKRYKLEGKISQKKKNSVLIKSESIMDFSTSNKEVFKDNLRIVLVK